MSLSTREVELWKELSCRTAQCWIQVFSSLVSSGPSKSLSAAPVFLKNCPVSGRMGFVLEPSAPALARGPSLPLHAPTATDFTAEPTRHLVGQQHREFTKSDDVIGASRVERHVARR